MKKLFIIFVLASLAFGQDRLSIADLGKWIQTAYSGTVDRADKMQSISTTNPPTIGLVPKDGTGKDTGVADIKMWVMSYTIAAKTFYLTVYSIDSLCFLVLPEAYSFLGKGYNVKFTKLTTANLSTAASK
jgi:hypothetical protein